MERTRAMPKFYHRAPERFGIYGKMPGFSNPARSLLTPVPLGLNATRAALDA
jgi:hypothetical protein